MNHPLRHRSAALALAAALFAAAGAAHAAPGDVFNEVLEASLKDKKGVILHVKGVQVSGRVTKVGSEAVELTSREYSRIVVRKDAIDGVASN